ncbi:MAG: hypothetical protein KDN05_02955 [Verrucomicrobiae bacterium]|nr:hypothetical protein [Verrucomicrobiae bacterium]
MKHKTLLAVGLAVVGFGPAMAGSLTLGTSTPPVGDGVENLSFSTSSADDTAVQFVPGNYMGSQYRNDGLQVGQSFTSGSNAWGYALNSISVRQVSWASDWDYDGGSVVLKIFRMGAGPGPVWNSASQLVVETATITPAGPPTTNATPTPQWLTFTLDTPLYIDPDTLYGFAIDSSGGIANEEFFMALDGTSTNSYADGFAFTIPDGATSSMWDGDNGKPSDRAFVANMTIPTATAVPDFVVDPENTTVDAGGVVVLESRAVSDPLPSYQWEFSEDGVNDWMELSGETDRILSIGFAIFSDVGYYRCVATTGSGSDTSAVASLDVVYAPPLITTQPTNKFVAEAATVVFTGDGTTFGAPGYQWYKDGSPLPGEESATLTISSAGPADEADYFLRLTDLESGLFTDTNVASLTLVNFPITSSSSAPEIDAADESYLPGAVSNDNLVNNTGAPQADNDAFTYISHDRVGQGMSFTTGSDPAGYSLNAITVQQVTYDTYVSLPDGTIFRFAFGTLDGTTKNEIYQGVGNYSGTGIFSPSTGNYLTFDLSGVSEIGNLLPETTYYFEVNIDLGVNAPQFPHIEWNGTFADSYAGGAAFGGDSLAGLNPTYVALNGDRAFHADLTGLGAPSGDFAAWIGGYDVGGMTGFTQDPDFDGLSSGVENFFGTAPNESSTGISAVTRTGANTFTFQHPQNASVASDVTAAYRWSVDLANWNTDGAESGGTTVSFATSTDAGVTTVTATVAGTVPPELFFEIEVTKADP